MSKAIVKAIVNLHRTGAMLPVKVPPKKHC